ncbi:nucleotidyltransferase family protein [Roseovarius sp.]|uniref:nucleotidyltransferase family protein n=1 Tax=Roseovarius sp. TaxID=1486281 RepID=UPI003D118651
MKAVILAGGQGLRMRPYTSILPKPLLPIGDLPIIEIILRRLEKAGVTDVVIAIGYLGNLIQTYLSQNSISERMSITYHLEEEPLGTAGAIGTIAGLDEPFFVMNGDLLSDIDFNAMMQHHLNTGADLTVGVVTTEVQIQLGVLSLGDEDTVIGYDEKPKMSYAASMGIYVYSPHVKSLIHPNAYLDAPSLVLRLIENAHKVSGFTQPCRWIDIGNPGEYERAQQEFAENPEAFLS